MKTIKVQGDLEIEVGQRDVVDVVLKAILGGDIDSSDWCRNDACRMELAAAELRDCLGQGSQAKSLLHPKGLKAWEAKYYPVPADKVPKSERARATLQRWRGLTPEVLAGYGLSKRGSSITDGQDSHLVCCDTCALCRGSCDECLLRQAWGEGCCCDDDGPYRTWGRADDAGPMIAALEKAALLEEERYWKRSGTAQRRW